MAVDDDRTGEENTENDLENTDIEAIKSNRKYALMEEVLKHQPEDVKERVRWLVELSGIRPNDPIFLILLSCRIVHVLLEKAPQNIGDGFDASLVKLAASLEKYLEKLEESQKIHFDKEKKHYQQLEAAALKISEAKVNSAIERILADNDLSRKGKISPRIWAIIATGAVGVTSMLTGLLAGWGWTTGQYARTDAVYLSREELNLLDWAKSDRGRYAKELFAWNDDLGDRSCQKKVKDLGVTIQIGTATATSGYCWIWVEPSSKRTYVRRR
jgi:hypothetical protein